MRELEVAYRDGHVAHGTPGSRRSHPRYRDSELIREVSRLLIEVKQTSETAQALEARAQTHSATDAIGARTTRHYMSIQLFD